MNAALVLSDLTLDEKKKISDDVKIMAKEAEESIKKYEEYLLNIGAINAKKS